MGRKFEGGEAARFMLRIDPELREEWQDEAGRLGIKLGPWIRMMVQRARKAKR
jgi:hypothetical protein